LLGLVHFVAESVLVEGVLEANLGDALGSRSNPGVVEAVGSPLKEAEVYTICKKYELATV
jgi:hypothetical protein